MSTPSARAERAHGACIGARLAPANPTGLPTARWNIAGKGNLRDGTHRRSGTEGKTGTRPLDAAPAGPAALAAARATPLPEPRPPTARRCRGQWQRRPGSGDSNKVAATPTTAPSERQPSMKLDSGAAGALLPPRHRVGPERACPGRRMSHKIADRP